MKTNYKQACAVLLAVLTAALSFSQTPAGVKQDLAAHIQKAQRYLNQKRPDLAIPELNVAVAIDPDNAEAQGNLGVLLYFQAKPAEAIPHLRIALERQPALTKIQGLLGIAELRTQDFADARKNLEAVLPQIRDRSFKSEVGLELVGLYTQEGDLDEAARVVAQLRRSDPDNAEVNYAAYRTYTDLATESMLALALSAPDSAQMHQVIAHEETKQGNTNGAIAHYRKAIDLNPHLPGIHFELAELLNTSSDKNVKSEAEKEYHVALAENRQDEQAELRLAEMDMDKRKLREAYEEYSRAVELQPAEVDAKLGLAKCLIEMNQEDRALALLEETVRVEPGNANAHYRLGMLYRKMGRMEETRREMDLFKKCKDAKEKLRALYKELLIHPEEITAGDEDEK
jgi:tetratricopeptide (TPR) repeat protein